MVDLGTLEGRRNSVAYGINDLGEVAGESDGHAFLYTDGQMIDLGTLGFDSNARGINLYGQVVGDSQTQEGEGHAFVDSDGTMTDLNTSIPPDSGWILIGANAINDAGQIVGTGVTKGQRHAFLLTPDEGAVPRGPNRHSPKGRPERPAYCLRPMAVMAYPSRRGEMP